ncbi:MAG: acyl-CoA dehydrogenase family protein [Cyanobacteria bacterium NC_groundwater_1444_Ag_S-0.65um_54_12]|nr:acyl-CoA dehydrogenase family protein [Cyanobacteria bacterium NC_groundwater_1444_Ag_S-0.65um_54_12]
MLREMLREFCNRELRPLAAKHDREQIIEETTIQKCAEQGLLGMAIPEEYGGAGAGEMGLCILAEELGRVDSSLGTLVGAHSCIGTYGILLDGTAELKQKYLPPVAAGELIAAFALTEAGAGSDAAAIKTSAVRDGDDWLLNGEKIWITNGDRADLFTVFVVTDKALGAHGGVTAMLVERAFGGVESGPREHKMGIRGSGTTTVTFRNTRVPRSHVLGDVGAGFRTAMKILDHGRLSLGAGCLGSAKEAFDLSLNYAMQRVQFGKPIIEQQAIQFYLADMATRIYAMENMVYHAAWLADRGESVTMAGSMVKLYCSEQATKIANRAVQIHGGMGYSAEYPVERIFRDARICEIFEGTNEIQRLVIARSLMKTAKKELAKV